MPHSGKSQGAARLNVHNAEGAIPGTPDNPADTDSDAKLDGAQIGPTAVYPADLGLEPSRFPRQSGSSTTFDNPTFG